MNPQEIIDAIKALQQVLSITYVDIEVKRVAEEKLKKLIGML